MKTRHAIIGVVVSVIGPNTFGEAQPELEVGFTFREVDVVVENNYPTMSKRLAFHVDPGKRADLTTEDIERVARQKLSSRGLKSSERSAGGGGISPTGSFFHIRIEAVAEVVGTRRFGTGFHVRLSLVKLPVHYGIPDDRGLGKSVFVGNPYGKIGIASIVSGEDRKVILKTVEEQLDRLILDYLESNLKYAATFKDKRLRGIDGVIKDAIANGQTTGIPSQVEWLKRYNALMKEK